jgi:hypothetical protein
MEKIKTQYGEIDLGYAPIEFFISDSELGTKVKVQFEGIRSMTESGEFANIVWLISQYSEEGERLNPLFVVQDLQVVTDVSGNNRVTNDGITIKREGFPEGEVGDRAYQMTFTIGHNEFTFWMSMLEYVPMPKVLALAATILDQFGRFDEIR